MLPKNILIVGSGGREYAIALKLHLQNADDKLVVLHYIGSSENAGLSKLCNSHQITDISDPKSNDIILNFS